MSSDSPWDELRDVGVGTRLELDDGEYEVVAFAPGGLQLAGPTERDPIPVHEVVRILAAAESRPVDADVPIMFSHLPADVVAGVMEKVAHANEVLTGFRSGDPNRAEPGEPRQPYAPGTGLMWRYAAKAAELKGSKTTTMRLVKAVKEGRLHDLVPKHVNRKSDPFAGVTSAWITAAEEVLREEVGKSKRSKKVVLEEIADLLRAADDSAEVPSRAAATRALNEMVRGKATFDGSTKRKRSIDEQPEGPFGHLVATHPGQYALADTTRLDLFAVDPVSLEWLPLELTVIQDLYSRCILGLTVTPVSTKAIDFARVLYEAIAPEPRPAGRDIPLAPAHGVPEHIALYTELISENRRLPSARIDTVIHDHGKIYTADAVRLAAERVGVSLQPARVGRPTDKAAIERWFGTLSRDLLSRLDSYKGASIHDRGVDVENKAVYFAFEIEMIIRDWIRTVYHQTPHRSLRDPHVPRLLMSPEERYHHGITRLGRLRLPTRPHLWLDLLPVEYRVIHDYGVEINGLRYDGQGLDAWRNRSNPTGRRHHGRWPISWDPDDVRHVWFHDPETLVWHKLQSRTTLEVDLPFSVEALDYARDLYRQRSGQRRVDDKLAVRLLVKRWRSAASGIDRRLLVRHLGGLLPAGFRHRGAPHEEDVEPQSVPVPAVDGQEAQAPLPKPRSADVPTPARRAY